MPSIWVRFGFVSQNFPRRLDQTWVRLQKNFFRAPSPLIVAAYHVRGPAGGCTVGPDARVGRGYPAVLGVLGHGSAVAALYPESPFGVAKRGPAARPACLEGESPGEPHPRLPFPLYQRSTTVPTIPRLPRPVQHENHVTITHFIAPVQVQDIGNTLGSGHR